MFSFQRVNSTTIVSEWIRWRKENNRKLMCYQNGLSLLRSPLCWYILFTPLSALAIRWCRLFWESEVIALTKHWTLQKTSTVFCSHAYISALTVTIQSTPLHKVHARILPCVFNSIEWMYAVFDSISCDSWPFCECKKDRDINNKFLLVYYRRKCALYFWYHWNFLRYLFSLHSVFPLVYVIVAPI